MSTTPEGLQALIERHEAAEQGRGGVVWDRQTHDDCGVLLDLLRELADRGLHRSDAPGVPCAYCRVVRGSASQCDESCPSPLLAALREATL